MKKFSLKRREEKVVLEGHNGEDRVVIVREMTGKQRDDYLNAMLGSMELGADGKPTRVKNFAGLSTQLLALTLHEGGQPVPLDQIETWPASVINGLFDIAQSINALTDESAQQVQGNA